MAITTPIHRATLILLSIYFTFGGLTACSKHSPISVSGSPNSIPQPIQTITLHCDGSAQVEIMGPVAQRVLIDVVDPESLSRPADKNDVLLTTHFHFDHYNQEFMDTFPGVQLQNRESKMVYPGLCIKGMAIGQRLRAKQLRLHA